MSISPAFRYPLWSRGDLDGFFGLMVDNLVQVLTIVALCRGVAGLPDEIIFERILPGVAISLLIGNVFYGVQAHWVARRDRNATCTALPYGVNTPSVIAYTLFIMGPVYRETGNATLAWQAGLLACLVSGVIEFLGAFVAEKLRRVTPRAALLGVLAAVGITFIAADFAFRIFTRPLIGIVPMTFLLMAYFAHYRFPAGLPGGFLAVAFGTAIAWGVALAEQWGVGGEVIRTWLGGSPGLSTSAVSQALSDVRWIMPVFCGDAIAQLFRPENQDLLYRFLGVAIPMGLINVLGSLQNIESAEAAGDRYPTAPSLAVNGIGTIAAGLFGSCFPTTIYIGHPGWKALGARAGYSILNGVFFTACFLGGLGMFLSAVIPIEAGAAIVMYIGIVITAQAFQATPKEHAPAVAVAIFPAMAAMLVYALSVYLPVSGASQTLADLVSTGNPATPFVGGLLTLTGANSGWIVVTLVLSAASTALIDRRFSAASWWFAIAAGLTFVGLIHAYRLEGNVLHELFVWQTVEPSVTEGAATVVAYRALPIALAYGLAAAILAVIAMRSPSVAEMDGPRRLL